MMIRNVCYPFFSLCGIYTAECSIALDQATARPGPGTTRAGSASCDEPPTKPKLRVGVRWERREAPGDRPFSGSGPCPTREDGDGGRGLEGDCDGGGGGAGSPPPTTAAAAASAVTALAGRGPPATRAEAAAAAVTGRGWRSKRSGAGIRGVLWSEAALAREDAGSRRADG